jgi:hypothetical protein
MRINASDTHSTPAFTTASNQTGQASVFKKLMESAGSELDTVEFRGGSVLLAATPLLTPSLKNAERLNAALEADLAEALRSGGFAAGPPVEVEVDLESGRIRVVAERPDAAAMENWINSDPALVQEVRTVRAIESHAQGAAESLAFQREYLASSDPQSVVAKYAWLFRR